MKKSGINISHPEKLLFPDDHINKQSVAIYYKNIAPLMLPYVKNRPLTLKRYTSGIGEDGFFVKHAQGYYPDFIEKITVPRHGEDKSMVMICVNDVRDLVYLSGIDTIEFHTTLSKSENFNNPDQIIIDFDPSDNDFDKVRQASLALKQILDQQNLPSFIKTTGSRGIHVHIPIKTNIPFSKAKQFSRHLAEALQARCPNITTLEQRKDKRGNKVFIDYLRNDYGMSAIAPYSLRALNNAPVATPIDWNEIKNLNLTPQRYHLKNIFKRIVRKIDPWQSFFHSAVDICKHPFFSE